MISLVPLSQGARKPCSPSCSPGSESLWWARVRCFYLRSVGGPWSMPIVSLLLLLLRTHIALPDPLRARPLRAHSRPLVSPWRLPLVLVAGIASGRAHKGIEGFIGTEVR